MRARRVRAFLLPVVVGLLVASCAGQSGPGGQSGGSGPLTSINFGHTSGTIDPYELPGYTEAFGDEFLGSTKVNSQNFSSTNTAIQVLLAGKLDIVEGSALVILPAISSGVELRMFCPYVAAAPGYIVGTGDIRTLADVGKPNATVAMESPGGPNNLFMDLTFQARGMPFATPDLKNTKILEDSPLRLAALMNGSANVALIRPNQLQDLRTKLGADNVHILSDVTKDARDSIYLAFIAKKEWLDAHPAEAAAFCASVLKTMQRLEGDYAQFKSLSDEHVAGGLSEELIKQQWDSIKANSLWPYREGLTKTAVDSVIQVAVKEELIEKPLTYEQVVDTKPFSEAAKLAGTG
jgi:ABC-type nitrate/sulfonate/bicarbonate transport system substrate-binding protein